MPEVYSISRSLVAAYAVRVDKLIGGVFVSSYCISYSAMTSLFLLALALSMDAFAVAISIGASTSQASRVHGAIRVGLAFGVAQALMPMLGWALGIAFAAAIQQVAHWLAFTLLLIIGIHMAYEGYASQHASLNESQKPPKSIATGWPLFMMAIATSIDAAAAGVTLALLGQPVLFACAVIGLVTLMMSAVGVILGKGIGVLAGQRAEVLGGLVLIGIGVKILVDRL